MFTKLKIKSIEREIDKAASEIETLISEAQEFPDEKLEKVIIAIGDSLKKNAKKIIPVARNIMDLYEAAVEPMVHVVKACLYLFRDLEKPFKRYVKSCENLSELIAEDVTAVIVDIMDQEEDL